jgi:hypothetical protein
MLRFLQGKQSGFFVLTFILIVAIVCLSDTVEHALIMVGLLTNVLIITAYTTELYKQHTEESSKTRAHPEQSSGPMGLPPARTAYTNGQAPLPPNGDDGGDGAAVPYPGGLAPEELAGLLHARKDVTGAVYPTTDTFQRAPAFGNPHNMSSLQHPEEPPACAGGEAGNAYDVLDADEQQISQARSRNDPYRAAAGALRRKDLVDRYLTSELDEEEHRYWWGRTEV